jgi:hypothetical protein
LNEDCKNVKTTDNKYCQRDVNGEINRNTTVNTGIENSEDEAGDSACPQDSGSAVDTTSGETHNQQTPPCKGAEG